MIATLFIAIDHWIEAKDKKEIKQLLNQTKPNQQGSLQDKHFLQWQHQSDDFSGVNNPAYTVCYEMEKILKREGYVYDIGIEEDDFSFTFKPNDITSIVHPMFKHVKSLLNKYKCSIAYCYDQDTFYVEEENDKEIDMILCIKELAIVYKEEEILYLLRHRNPTAFNTLEDPYFDKPITKGKECLKYFSKNNEYCKQWSKIDRDTACDHGFAFFVANRG